MSKPRSIRRIIEKVYWREADARLVLESWRESGESLRAFARRHGVQRARLSRWRARLDSSTDVASEHAAPVAFRAVRLTGGISSDADRAPIEIELGCGALVRLARGVDPGDLRAVLSALEPSRC